MSSNEGGVSAKRVSRKGSLLSPFYDATVELSAEENVSASKVVPLMKMLEQNLQEEITKPALAVALEIGDQLIRQLREKLYTL